MFKVGQQDNHLSIQNNITVFIINSLLHIHINISKS